MSDVDTPTPEAAPERAEPKPTRPRWFVPALIGAGALIVLAAAGSVAAAVALSAPHTFTAKGVVMLSGTDCASIPPGYEDITKGADVTVKDPSGKVIGLGELGAGKDLGSGIGCAYFFSVKDVPSGLGIYGIEVTHRGLLQYKEASLKKDGAVMSMDASSL